METLLTKKEAKERGEKLFRHEKECERCGSYRRYTTTGSCYECALSRYYREYPKAHAQNRRSLLKRRYGITPEDYSKLFEEQQGRCSVCNDEMHLPGTGVSRNRVAAVDHCHKTGRIRSLLCGPCNKGIGLFKEDPQILEHAIEYLQKHNSH